MGLPVTLSYTEWNHVIFKKTVETGEHGVTWNKRGSGRQILQTHSCAELRATKWDIKLVKGFGRVFHWWGM